ncbi:MAG: PadR family transcriptional regulator [Candidatus Micrarchaeota archaeon]
MANNSRPLARLERSLTTENLWLYILSTLKKKRTYAYALNLQIKERFGWKPGLITSYLVFYKLQAEGLITSKYDERRKYYEITKKGKDALMEGKKMLLKLAKDL